MKRTETEMGLVFHCRLLLVLLYLLVATFLIITFPNFLLFLCMHVWTQHVSSNVLPCWYLVSGNPTAWLFINLLIPGDQTNKIKGYDGGIPNL